MDRCRKSLLPSLIKMLACLLVLMGLGGRHVIAQENRHVLILNSYHQGIDWTDGEVAGIREALSQKPGVQFHIEYMDTKRLADQEHFNNLRQLFAYKYRFVRFDAIVTTDNDAFDFVRKYRQTLFSGIPVVFCGVNWFRDEQLNGLSGITGVAETADNKATLDLMLRLHPKTEQIVVIIDLTTTGRALRSQLESDLSRLNKNVAVDFWDHGSPDELADKAFCKNIDPTDAVCQRWCRTFHCPFGHCPIDFREKSGSRLRELGFLSGLRHCWWKFDDGA